MRRLVDLSRAGRLALLVPAVAVVVPVVGIAEASAAAVDVCPSGCPYTQLAPALAAAQSGDKVTIGPGSYAGGVTIDVSVKLVGAGPGRTIIRGGGPVLTIGVPDAPREPTVRIEGVTITGGVTIGNLTPFSGRGGGIYIPRAAGPSTGATVTIRDSVVRANSVAPSVAVESDDPCCPFADSGGGGISNDGTLTLEHTLISENRADAASGLASNAIGGGILNRGFGTLTLKDSLVSANHAAVSAPNGRFTSGGGIEMVGGTLTIDDSQVSDNSADSSLEVPTDVEQSTTGGGIHVQENASATIRDTTIDANSVRSTNSVGDVSVFSGGLHANGPIVVRDSTIRHNSAAGTTATGKADVDSGAGEINADSTIRNTRFTGNSVTATSSAGEAHGAGGGILTAAFERTTISGSVVSGNRVTATTTSGSSTVEGAGIANIGVLTLRNTSVTDNSAGASGPDGALRGGGIFVGSDPVGPPAPRLALVGSAVTHNTLTARPGIAAQGGGVFALFPVTLRHSVIAQNVPDQCQGC